MRELASCAARSALTACALAVAVGAGPSAAGPVPPCGGGGANDGF